MSLDFKIADTPHLREQAFRLRYEVFGKELGYLKPEEYPDGMEHDKFDLMETTTNFLALDNEKPIATARLCDRNNQLAEEENSNYGLSIENVFDFSRCKDKGIEIGEISRSAVIKKYRGSRSIVTLWGLIIEYGHFLGRDILFTNANMETDSLDDAKLIYDLMRKGGHTHKEIMIPPHDKFMLAEKKENLRFKIFNNDEPPIPNILEMYIKIGLKYVSRPIYYQDFDMCSILAILEYDYLNVTFKKFFRRSWEKFKVSNRIPERS